MMKIMFKKNTVKLTIVAISVMASLASHAQEVESINFSGEVNSVVPEINVRSSVSPTAFVENIELAISEIATHCDFTTTPNELNHSFKAGSKPVCLFEWNDAINGLAHENLVASGIVNRDGEVEFPYTISIIIQGTKEVFYAGVYTMNIETPIASVITGISTFFDGKEVTSNTVETYNKKAEIETVDVFVEERGFDQRVVLLEDTCIVPEGSLSCQIKFNNFIPGATDESLIGTEILDVGAIDKLDYLQLSSDQVQFNYDYRPPVIEDIIVNGTKEETVEFTIDGETFLAEKNTGYIVINSPHINKDGEWWIPQFRNGTAQNKSVVERGIITVEDFTIDLSQYSRAVEEEYSFSVDKEYTRVGDKLIYPIDLNPLPDGLYDIELDVQDTYGNASESISPDKLLDRAPPLIVGIKGGANLSESRSTNAIFLNDYYFLAVSGWDDGTSITDVTLNGVSTGFEYLGQGVIKLQDRSDLEVGGDYELLVKAEDANGNATLADFKLTYINTMFNMTVRTPNIFAGTQNADVTLRRTRGEWCNISSTAENAILTSTDRIKSCVFEVSTDPLGLELISSRRNVRMSGVIDQIGEYELGFNVAFYHKDGSVKRIDGGTGSINVIENPDIELALLDRNKVSEGVYSTPINSNIVNTLSLAMGSSLAQISVDSMGDSFSRTISESKNPNMRRFIYKTPRVDDGNVELWRKIPYSVKANYVRKPALYDIENFEAIITPSTRTQAYLFSEIPNDATTENTINFRAAIGQYQRSEDAIIYQPEIMGDWNVSIAIKDGKDYIKIGETISIDESGEAEFQVSGLDLFEKGRIFYALAEAKSPFADFGMQLVSRSARVEILKGEALEGTVSTRMISGEVPFSNMLVFQYNSSDDRKVDGGFSWEKSVDGQNWETVSGQDNTNRFRLRMLDPVKEYFRVKMTNDRTRIESYSDVVEIQGFEVSDIQISGPRQTIIGLDTIYTAKIEKELRGQSDGVYEWSTDNGETWESGTDSYSITPDANFILTVRHRLDSSDVLSEDAYSVDTMRVSAVVAERLTLRNASDDHLEVGIEGQVGASYTLFNGSIEARVIEQITLPNGDVLDAGLIGFTPRLDDIVSGSVTLQYTAWIDGLKEATETTLPIRIPAFDYKFEAPLLDIAQRYTIAPTQASARVNLNIHNAAPDTMFQYEWTVDEDKDIEITRERGSTAHFMLKEEGLQSISVNITDNKGNQAELTQMVDVQEMAPLEIEFSSHFTKRIQTAPIGVSTRARVRLEHPRDFVESIQWEVNGVIQETSSSSAFLEMTEAGTYQVVAKVRSKYGQVGEGEFSVEVNPNIPPVCSPILEDRGLHMVIVPNCSDEDGQVIAYYYQWEDNEEQKLSSSLSFRKESHPTLTVNIRVVDNGSEDSTFNVEW